MTFGNRRRRRVSSRTAGTRTVCHPDISVPVDKDPMRCGQQTGAETFEELATLVEVQDWIEHGVLTGVGATALGNPNRFSILVYFDGACRTPGSTFRQLRPVRNRLIGIRHGVRWLPFALRIGRKKIGRASWRERAYV